MLEYWVLLTRFFLYSHPIGGQLSFLDSTLSFFHCSIIPFFHIILRNYKKYKLSEYLFEATVY
jgi:hypothetical protein